MPSDRVSMGMYTPSRLVVWNAVCSDGVRVCAQCQWQEQTESVYRAVCQTPFSLSVGVCSVIVADYRANVCLTCWHSLPSILGAWQRVDSSFGVINTYLHIAVVSHSVND